MMKNSHPKVKKLLEERGFPSDTIENVLEYYDKYDNLKDKNIVSISDGFGAGKSTFALTRLKEGDAYITDTHDQAREKMVDYKHFYSKSNRIQLASIRKYIECFLTKRKRLDEKEDIIIERGIMNKLKKCDIEELEKFYIDLQDKIDDHRSAGYYARKLDYSQDIIYLCSEMSKFFKEEEKFLETSELFTVKHMLPMINPSGTIYIDESNVDSFQKYQRKTSIALEKIDNIIISTITLSKHITPPDIMRKMRTAKKILSILDADGDNIEKIFKMFNSNWRAINHEKFKDIFPNDSFQEILEEVREWDINDIKERGFDLLKDRIKEAQRDPDKSIEDVVSPEIDIAPILKFVKEALMYGCKIRKITPDEKDMRKETTEIKVYHHFIYDVFEKSLDNKIVLLDAEYDEDWLKRMFDRWEQGNQAGVTLEDIGLKEISILEEGEIDAPFTYLHFGKNGENGTIRNNCYTPVFENTKSREYRDKYIRMRQLGAYLNHKEECHDTKIGLVTTKKGKENVFSNMENVLHFANMQGSNKLKDVDWIYVIGTPRISDMKGAVERNFGKEVPSIEEIADMYDDVHPTDFFVGSYFKGKDFGGKAKYTHIINTDVELSDYHKDVLKQYEIIWNHIIAKVRQAIGRKRNWDEGGVIRGGIIQHTLYENFNKDKRKHMKFDEFMKKEMKKHACAREDIRDDLNDMIEEGKKSKKKVKEIPPYLRRFLEGRNTGAGTDKVKLNRKPNGYDKEIYVRCCFRNGMSVSDIADDVKMKVGDIEKIIYEK